MNFFGTTVHMCLVKLRSVAWPRPVGTEGAAWRDRQKLEWEFQISTHFFVASSETGDSDRKTCSVEEAEISGDTDAQRKKGMW